MILNMVGGSSSNGANIEVVSGSTQPNAPKEYTIWVKSNVAVSEWEMGITQNPTWSMNAGFVYLYTNTAVYDGATTFNPLKKNWIFLATTIVWQNQGTSTNPNWVRCEAYLYKAGSWVKISSTTTIPAFTYTGSYQITDDNGTAITTSTGNWQIKFLTSGTLTFSSLNGAADGIDVFCVGGGGGGGTGYGKNVTNEGWFASGGGGGGGGYTSTTKGKSIATSTSYTISIGAGGSAGNNATYANQPGTGGAGGSKGGTGGNYNTVNTAPGSDGSPGQGTTTRPFGDSTGIRYGGGGGGGRGFNNYGNLVSAYVSGGADTGAGSSESANANTGGGGGGGGVINTSGTLSAAGAGGSGIVIIRNKR